MASEKAMQVARGIRSIIWEWLEAYTDIPRGDKLPEGDYEMFPHLEDLANRLEQAERQAVVELTRALESVQLAGLGILNGVQPLKGDGSRDEQPKSWLNTWRVKSLGEAMQKAVSTLATYGAKGV